MDPAVESQRQVQLTFHDKSTDGSLSAEVTREAWLSEVEQQLQATPTVQEASGISTDASFSAITMSNPNAIMEGFAVIVDDPDTSAERVEMNRADDAGVVVSEDAPAIGELDRKSVV